MSKLHETRLRLHKEVEVPVALRRFGDGWNPVLLGYVPQFKDPFQREESGK
jgi:hypothetical protein